MTPKQTPAARFGERVDTNGPNGCHVWKGHLKPEDGYGQFWLEGRTRRAHRVSLYLQTGAWPNGVVLHLCDNPSCVNPAHLSVGTIADNVQDMITKGRHVVCPGEKNGKARLTETQAREILSATQSDSSTLSRRELATKYNVSRGHRDTQAGRYARFAWHQADSGLRLNPRKQDHAPGLCDPRSTSWLAWICSRHAVALNDNIRRYL